MHRWRKGPGGEGGRVRGGGSIYGIGMPTSAVGGG